MQLASLADMGVSLPRVKKLSVCCVAVAGHLFIYSSIGRIVGDCELCSLMLVFTLLLFGLLGSRTQAM